MKSHPASGGYVLLLAVLLVLAVLTPTFLFFSSNSIRQMKANKKILSIRKGENTLKGYLSTVLNFFQTDFYQDPYLSQTSLLSLLTVSRENKCRFGVFSVTRGRDYLKDARTDSGQSKSRVLIHFRNDALRFGVVVENGLTINAFSPLDNATLNGGVYVGGDLDLSAAHAVLANRPIVVDGTVTGGPNVALLPGTTVYYSQTLHANGGSFQGVTFDEVPPLDILSIDLTNYRFKCRAWSDVSAEPVKSATWTFTQVGGECRRYYGPGVDDYQVADFKQDMYGWPIFALEGGNLYLRGQCSAKATIVAYASPVSSDAGNIFVIDDFGQTPGAAVSTSTSAFAAIASGKIIFNKGGPQDVYGYYYAQSFGVANNEVAGVPTQARLHGTIHATVGFLPIAAGNTLSVEFDPNLTVNVPPGVPERPLLLTYSQGE